MKLSIKNIQLMLVVLSFAAILSSCNKEADISVYQYPPATVTGMTPTSGYPGIYVNITGTNFGNWPKAAKIWFGGVQAEAPESISDNSISVKVPDGAVSGKVTVQVWTTVLDSIGSYTVIPAPVLESVVSEGDFGAGIATAGDTVVLTGSGFGTDASQIEVSFNGTDATIIQPVTDNMFRVVAPEGYASGIVYFTKGGLTLAGDPLMNPDVKGDVTIFYLKNYQQPFTSTPESGDGRWRNPTDWIVTDPIKNHGGYGGWGSDNGTVLAIESGWGAADVVGGAMYQTAVLPAGTYTFSAELGPNGFDDNSVFLVVAEGTSIPTEAPTTSNTLGFADLHAGSFDFTLTEKTEVSLGIDVVSMTGNRYWRVKSLSLVSK